MPRLIGFLTVLVAARCAWAGDAPDYAKEIKPILQRRCYSCHGALKQKGNLRLDVRSTILKGGDGGSAIEPGKASDSLLIAAVTGKDGLQRMPLEGEPLSPEEIAKLTDWINAGAPAPDEPLPADPRQHWSFQRPLKVDLPAVADREWQQNPIDTFIAAEHQRRGLTPRPEAARNVLLRRVYLDLIGLPPTRREVAEFQNDTSPDAYEKVVDRLLASPQYGERWARHWMDVWRYSDWDGYGAEVRESQAHIWRWRDWIVESLNADKGYDQMIHEMLAADEIAPEDTNSLRATGFLVRNYYRFNRHIWMDNTVEHTSKAFLGMTVNCARCHDHMYDPIAQQEYYQMRAIFEPYDVRTDRISPEPDLTKDGLVRVYDAHHSTATFLFTRGDDKQPVKDKPISPAFLSALGGSEFAATAVNLPANAYYPGLQKRTHDEALAAAAAEIQRTEGLVAASQQAVTAANQRLTEFRSNPNSSEQVSPILDDRFAEARPEVWKQSTGKWEYRDGRLFQLEPTSTNCDLISSKPLPRDFHAKFRLKITGGQMWKSVGLTFDNHDNNAIGVYLSAVAGGMKAQLYNQVNGQTSYPAEAMKPLPIMLGEEHELQVFTRDQLVNVAVDGKLLFAYKLAQPRAATNELRLFTFDATAEFLSIQVNALGADTRLAEKVEANQSLPVPMPPSVESLTVAINAAEQTVKKAELARAVAVASRAAVEARIAADVATYSVPPSANSQEVAQQAVKLERELTVKQAELTQWEKDQAVALAKTALKPDDEKSKAAVTAAEAQVAESVKALEAARAAVAQPLTADYKRFGTVYPATSTGRRLALARWITSNENPLAARVAVNHLWLRHFNSPLVPTVFDFGLNGKAPTHPALLDWLAVELMQNGWKMKPIHRLLVTSRTYRSLSHGQGVDDSNSKSDPENVYYWRMNSRRMEAEIIRDSTLAVCGQLDQTLGGPDLDPNTGLTVARRSLYFRSAKEKKVTFLAMFDSPNVVECYRRSESIVPQQALAMTNSPLTLAQARLLTKRLTSEVGEAATPELNAKFIDVAFQQILARPATPPETQQCQAFLQSQMQRFADPKGLTTFQGGVDTPVPPSPVPHLRARENLVHVLLNHNEFVTIR